ncbi:hypothetical protein OJAV_G00105760 [Oryzias javanicus]|uniref:Uncharacterized protein n=1 Tax=Oryzias javanicus TaxID=123683 RepID=A0A437CVX3_ORYJA|nr:hypothetical protein OJAV_G00105760 [Oryzias javanicus]
MASLLLSRATCGLQRQNQTAPRTRTFQKRVECLDVCCRAEIHAPAECRSHNRKQFPPFFPPSMCVCLRKTAGTQIGLKNIWMQPHRGRLGKSGEGIQNVVGKLDWEDRSRNVTV